MATKPSFGALTKRKPVLVEPVNEAPPRPVATAKPAVMVTTVRLDVATWTALKALAARRSVETGAQVTLNALLLEGAAHVLAVHGRG